jgi:hypothetical protein
MKFHVIGVKRIEGTAKASGNPFDMCRLFCLVPIEIGAGKTKVSGFGMEVAEMELEPEALQQFAGLKFPADVELRIDQKFVFGEFRSVVTGLEGQAKPLQKVG